MRDAGHRQKIRDCPGRFGTVGTYGLWLSSGTAAGHSEGRGQNLVGVVNNENGVVRSAAARAKRFKQPDIVEAPSYAEHINALGMVASLVGLLMQVRTAIAVSPGSHVFSLHSSSMLWVGVFCSVVYMTNAGPTEDKKQTFSLLM